MKKRERDTRYTVISDRHITLGYTGVAEGGTSGTVDLWWWVYRQHTNDIVSYIVVTRENSAHLPLPHGHRRRINSATHVLMSR
jgi:hypothetical protein